MQHREPNQLDQNAIVTSPHIFTLHG